MNFKSTASSQFVNFLNQVKFDKKKEKLKSNRS